MLDAGFRVIRNDNLGHSANELQGVNVRADPAAQILASGSFHEGITAGSQYGHEQRGFKVRLAAPGIINGNLVASVIDKQFLAAAVVVHQKSIRASSRRGLWVVRRIIVTCMEAAGN